MGTLFCRTSNSPTVVVRPFEIRGDFEIPPTKRCFPGSDCIINWFDTPLVYCSSMFWRWIEAIRREQHQSLQDTLKNIVVVVIYRFRQFHLLSVELESERATMTRSQRSFCIRYFFVKYARKLFTPPHPARLKYWLNLISANLVEVVLGAIN